MISSSKMNVVRALGPYAFQSVLIAACVAYAFSPWLQDPTVPVNNLGDALHHLMITRAMIDHGWWWWIAELCTPFGLNMRLFPVTGLWDTALLWMVTRAVANVGLALNVYFWSMFFVAGWTAKWAFSKLGLSNNAATVFGVAYALLPHLFYRNTAHLMLVHYLVPLMCLIALLVAANRIDEQTRFTRIVLLVGCGATGLSYIYTSFFACFLILVGMIVCPAAGWLAPARRFGWWAIAIVIGTTALGLAPSAAAWQADPAAAKEIRRKSFVEAERYGLKIQHLVRPISSHPIDSFSRAGTRGDKRFPLENENNNARLGTLGGVGVLALLLALFIPAKMTRNKADVPLLEQAAKLNIAAILLATIGGLGVLFNMAVAGDVRAYNRISVFIGFLALLAVYLVFRGRFKRLDVVWRKPIVPFAVSLAVVVILFDQAPIAGYDAKFQQMRDRRDNMADFLDRASARLGPEAMIYQLPDLPYPSNPHRERYFSQDALLPFTVSTNLRWSFPCLGSQGTDWHRSLATATPDQVARQVKAMGFQAILIDRFAYADNGKQTIESYQPHSQDVIVDRAQRYALLTLR